VFQENEVRNMASGKVNHSPKIATTFPLPEEVEDGKNRHLVKCQRCPSKILNPGMGVYKQIEVSADNRQQYNSNFIS
jgi:DNA-directed RNA polymerase subunit RPC12/RpoP